MFHLLIRCLLFFHATHFFSLLCHRPYVMSNPWPSLPSSCCNNTLVCWMQRRMTAREGTILCRQSTSAWRTWRWVTHDTRHFSTILLSAECHAPPTSFSLLYRLCKAIECMGIFVICPSLSSSYSPFLSYLLLHYSQPPSCFPSLQCFLPTFPFPFLSPSSCIFQAYRLKKSKREDPMALFADSEELLEYDQAAPRKDLTDHLAGHDNTSVISNRYEL